MSVIPSASAISRLGRMVAANVYPTLDNAALAEALGLFAVRDSERNIPGDAAWVETFDMNGAAAECMRWKLAVASVDVSFTVDGSTTTLDQLTQHLRSLEQAFEARRSTGTISVAINAAR
jgi:hypothetical protein